VGDYPVDHHRKKNPVPKQIEFPGIPSYSVPYGTLIPEVIDGLIVAEKSISVSNVVNGTTRLQPVVMQLGQAAGAAAAMSIAQEIEPRELNVRDLQTELLDAGVWLMPYMDTDPESIFFRSIQHVGLSGIMRGEGIPVAWANETRFYPDSTLGAEQLSSILSRIDPAYAYSGSGTVSRLNALEALMPLLDESVSSEDCEASGFMDTDSGVVAYFSDNGWIDGWITGDEFEPQRPITRGEFALIIDRALDPFTNDPVEIGFPNPVIDE
jgi:hypothetical protein